MKNKPDSNTQREIAELERRGLHRLDLQQRRQAVVADISRRLDESDGRCDPVLADRIDAILTTGIPRKGRANEAVFYNRAADRSDRVVLTAVFRGLEERRFHDTERLLDWIARGYAFDEAAVRYELLNALEDDHIRVAEQFTAFYRDELVPQLLQRASEVGSHAETVLALRQDREVTLLLRNDGLTISLHRAFEQLDMLACVVGWLTDPAHGNARVAVTAAHGDDISRGHARATSEAALGLALVEAIPEPLSRELRARGTSPGHRHQAWAVELIDRLDRTFAMVADGNVELLDHRARRIGADALIAEVEACLRTSGA